jgi:hypothetical protein
VGTRVIGPGARAWGVGLVELLVVLVVAAAPLAITVPALAAGAAESRTAAGARELAMMLHACRWHSVARGVARGLAFRRDATGWYWLEVEDGNGNGLRTGEVADGTDAVRSPTRRLEHRVAGVTLGFPAGPIPSIPPGRGPISRLDDPVRFGTTDIVSFGPLGSASSGTLYVTDWRNLYAIVLFGPTARVRVWRYDEVQRRWTL